MNVKTIFACGILISVVFIGINFLDEVAATNNTYYIDDSGEADFTTIADALASPMVTDDDTLIVRDGTYTEYVNVDKQVTIRGDTDCSPTVNPTNPSFPVFDINERDVTIQDFTIIGIYENPLSVCGVRSDVTTATEHTNINLYNLEITGFQVGIEITRTNPEKSYPTTHTISGCEIYENGGGIFVQSEPSPGPYSSTGTTIIDCDIYDNTLFSTPFGIEIHGDLNYVQDTDISGHLSESIGYGLKLEDADNNDIYFTGNEGKTFNIYDNTYAIHLSDSTYNDIRDEISIYSNGDFWYGGATTVGYITLHTSSHNIFFDLEIYENAGEFKIGDNSDYNEIDECEIYDNDNSATTNWNKISIISNSDHNTIEDSTIERTSVGDDESSIIISDYCLYNIVTENSFDGYIDIHDYSDSNTISGMSFLSVKIYNSDSTIISGCTFDPGFEVGLETYGVSLWLCDEAFITDCDVVEADIAFIILDSTDVEIYGDEGSHSQITDALTILDIRSDDLSSTVRFQDYDITDCDNTVCDMDVRGTSTEQTSLAWYDLEVDEVEVDNNVHFKQLLEWYVGSPDYYTLIENSNMD